MSLTKEIRSVIARAVGVALPIWQSRPAVDYKRVPVMTGPGSYQLEVRPYQGVQGWIAFKHEFEGNPVVAELEAALALDCPKLLEPAHVPGEGWSAVSGAFPLICALCAKSDEYVASGKDPSEAVGKVVNELSQLIETETLKIEVVSMLSALMLPVGVEEVDFGDVVLKRINQQHIEKYACNDITHLPQYDLISDHITTALFMECDAHLCFGQSMMSSDGAWLDRHNSIQIVQNNIFDAFFLLKQGHFHIVATHRSFEPLSLPGMNTYTSISRGSQVFGFYMLEPHEIDEVKRLYVAIKSLESDRVRQAITRLRFSEGRARAVDALVDVMVGFEAILNPIDDRELSFRIALNYAFLFPETLRREKFDELSRVQKFRNRIVHGGMKSNDSKQMEELAEILQIAKEGLRNCIKMLMFDLEFGIAREKLDANFWLDRVMARPSSA